MKKYALLALVSFMFCRFAAGQVLCIYCYNQKDSISSGVHNLVKNGGFENTNCVPNSGSVSSHTSFCPKSAGYACDFTDWTCTGGGTDTYACLYNSTLSIIVEGNNAAYFGNLYANACSPSTDDTTCMTDSGCVVTGIPAGYPVNAPSYGGDTGVSLQQTVTGLIPGNVYILEFWAGGENRGGGYSGDGLFAVDVGFGKIMMRSKATEPLSADLGVRYLIEFKATSSSHTIKFTNWGHICGSCTELVLDNVRLYTLAELSASVTSCAGINPPLAHFKSSDSTICANDCINFTDLSSNATSWTWTFDGGNPAASSAQNPHSCYLTGGIYNVKLVVSNSAGSDSTTFTNYINVKSAPPTPNITQHRDTLFCSTDSTYASYQWYTDSTIITGATDTFLVISNAIHYNLKVVNKDGCKIAVGITVGINELNQSNYIAIFPNPAGKEIRIISPMAERIEKTDIYNVLGERVYSQPSEIVNLPTGQAGPKSEISIDVSSLPAGIYFVFCSGKMNDNRRQIGRFVKE